MAKSCAGCGFYDATGDAATCPTCNRATQTTFLPPAGADIGPAIKWAPPLGRCDRAARAGEPFNIVDFLARNRLMMGIMVAPVLICLKLAFGISPTGRGADDVQKRYDRVQVGMTTAQVEQILYFDVRRPPQRRSRQFLQDGSATMSYENDGVRLTVEFLNGRVARKAITGGDEGDEEP
jgi:hypothetical protein